MLSQIIDQKILFIKTKSKYQSNNQQLYQQKQNQICKENQGYKQNQISKENLSFKIQQYPQLVRSNSSIIGKNVCTECNKCFLKNAHLQRHIEERHKNNRSFLCQFPQCGKNFKRDSHLRRHIVSHTHQKSFQCSQCIMAFGYKHHLDRHVKTIHEKKLLNCTQCNIGFIKRKALSKHIQNTHRKNKECSRKSSTDMIQLESSSKIKQKTKKINKKIKKQTKTTEKQTQKLLYRCVYPECISAFNHKHQLSRHLSKTHANQIIDQIDQAEIIQNNQQVQKQVQSLQEQIFQEEE